MEQIRVGKIVNTFGIKGELKVQIITDFPEERFIKDQHFFVWKEDKKIDLVLKNCRYHQNHALLLFYDYEDINLSETFKGCDLYIDKEDIEPLEDGFYAFDLIGMKVYHDQTEIGIVKSVDQYPAHSNLRVDTGSKTVLIPFVDAFIDSVDEEKGIIQINVIEGLL